MLQFLSRRRMPWLILSLFLLFIVSCTSGTPVPPVTGLLYVLDRVNKAVYVYDNVNSLNGPSDPVRTISGDLTLIQTPTAITVDTIHDILYVADTNSQQVLAFIPASQNDGNIAPRRTYPGLARASSLFYDLKNDRLYAGDDVDLAVQVWDGLTNLKNGTPPGRRIGVGYQPTGVFVNTDSDLLFVGDPAGSSVNVYKNASTQGGNAAKADSTIQDLTLPFVNILSLTMNPANDILFVAESFNPSVEIFDRASEIPSTPVPSDRSLIGSSTTLTTDMEQVLFLQNVLYLITDRTHVGIWDNANTVTGDTAPTRNITVNPAAVLTGIFVDMSH